MAARWTASVDGRGYRSIAPTRCDDGIYALHNLQLCPLPENAFKENACAQIVLKIDQRNGGGPFSFDVVKNLGDNSFRK